MHETQRRVQRGRVPRRHRDRAGQVAPGDALGLVARRRGLAAEFGQHGAGDGPGHQQRQDQHGAGDAKRGSDGVRDPRLRGRAAGAHQAFLELDHLLDLGEEHLLLGPALSQREPRGVLPLALAQQTDLLGAHAAEVGVQVDHGLEQLIALGRVDQSPKPVEARLVGGDCTVQLVQLAIDLRRPSQAGGHDGASQRAGLQVHGVVDVARHVDLRVAVVDHLSDGGLDVLQLAPGHGREGQDQRGDQSEAEGEPPGDGEAGERMHGGAPSCGSANRSRSNRSGAISRPSDLHQLRGRALASHGPGARSPPIPMPRSRCVRGHECLCREACGWPANCKPSRARRARR